jgi:putative transposase
MTRKRHSSKEIAAKLSRAEQLAMEGKSQREIARAIGISIMTYHRWRKIAATETAPPLQAASDPEAAAGRSTASRRELEDENKRLRRLVSDLMLEKMALQEKLDGRRR